MRFRARAVLCDLDDTLFDHAYATRQALTTLQAVDRALAGWPMDEFVGRHSVILEALHRRVLAGEITVDEARLARFTELLAAAGVADAAGRAIEIAPIYRDAYAAGWRAVPGAHELLDALRADGCRIVIVTNNGVAEQRRKLARCDLESRIDVMVTSEETACPKPGAAIFDAALAHARAELEDVVMFGDGWETDIEGARRRGIRAVWFNPSGRQSPDSAVAELAALAPIDRTMRTLFPRT